MKKLWFYFLALLVPAMMCVSCDDASLGNNGEGGGSGSGSGTGGKDDFVMPTNPDEQKQTLENTATALMDDLAAENFEDVTELVAYLAEEYSEYNFSELEDWSDDCFKAMVGVLKDSVVEEWGSYGVGIYRYYDQIISFSNLTGKFEAKAGKWKRTDANDLSFHVKDEQGNPCVLRLTTSGKTKKVYAGENRDWKNYYYDEETGKYVDEYDVYDTYINVPEKLTVTIDQNGKNIARLIFNIDLSSMKGEEFDLSKDKYNVTATFEFNGYSINLDRLRYVPESGSAISVNFKKNSKTLLSAKISGDIDVTNEEFFGSVNNNIEFDVMGDIQVKGIVAGDISDLARKMDELYEHDTNEKEFKKALDKINNMFDLNLYYNYSQTPSASFELRPFKRDSYYYTYWYAEWTVVFDDGSSYSIEEFFNEDDFKKLIKAFERLLEDYEDMMDDAFENM
ncbi:MAG: hypothetical protein IKY19_06330 [Bacteroidaceae bacterium]|nr:hypothetical protein [Bacteroidaceae bacterium]